jgi:hypothetical protein
VKRPYGSLAALLMLSSVALFACSGTTSGPDRQAGVAILVVDDFGFGKSQDEKPGTRDENCTIGANEVGSNGAGDDTPSMYSHGELVYQVARDELSGMLGKPDPGSLTTSPGPTAPPSPLPASPSPLPNPLPPTETAAEWKAKDGRPVRLVAVHTQRYKSVEVIEGIKSEVASLVKSQRFDRFVVNLSFVVIPCDVVDWLSDKDQNALFAAYDQLLAKDTTLRDGLKDFVTGDRLDPVKARAKAPNANLTDTILKDDRLARLRPYLAGAFYNQINGRALGFAEPNRQPPQKNALMTVYADQGGKNLDEFIRTGGDGISGPVKIIPVGAAGNGVKYGEPPTFVGLPFPFAPALWDYVVSVSSTGPHLNSGEVTLPGGGPAMEPNHFGTSFAAPRMSALEAMYLLKTGLTNCGASQNPPLGYVAYYSGPVSVSPVSPWENTDKSAWNSKCATFLSNLP